jgi:hypothetical protein
MVRASTALIATSRTTDRACDPSGHDVLPTTCLLILLVTHNRADPPALVDVLDGVRDGLPGGSAMPAINQSYPLPRRGAGSASSRRARARLALRSV